MSTPQPRRRSFPTSDGIDLVADEYPGRPGHTVVLTHGGGQTRHAWGKAARVIAEAGWRVVNLDLRGHGESGWSPDGAYTLARFSGDVAAVAGQLDRPVLVGASLGGLSSMTAIAEHGASIASALVLVDVAPRLEVTGVNRIRDFMATGLEGFATLEDVADAVASYLPHRPRPKDLSGLRKNVRQRDDGRWVWHWDPAFMRSDEHYERIEDSPMVNPDQLRRSATKVSVPTLLVRGGASDVVSPEGAAELKALIPHAEVVDVAAAGHMVAGDRNDRFNSAVLEFLMRLTTKA